MLLNPNGILKLEIGFIIEKVHLNCISLPPKTQLTHCLQVEMNHNAFPSHLKDKFTGKVLFRPKRESGFYINGDKDHVNLSEDENNILKQVQDYILNNLDKVFKREDIIGLVITENFNELLILDSFGLLDGLDANGDTILHTIIQFGTPNNFCFINFKDKLLLQNKFKQTPFEYSCSLSGIISLSNVSFLINYMKEPQYMKIKQNGLKIALKTKNSLEKQEILNTILENIDDHISILLQLIEEHEFASIEILVNCDKWDKNLIPQNKNEYPPIIKLLQLLQDVEEPEFSVIQDIVNILGNIHIETKTEDDVLNLLKEIQIDFELKNQLIKFFDYIGGDNTNQITNNEIGSTQYVEESSDSSSESSESSDLLESDFLEPELPEFILPESGLVESVQQLVENNRNQDKVEKKQKVEKVEKIEKVEKTQNLYTSDFSEFSKNLNKQKNTIAILQNEIEQISGKIKNFDLKSISDTLGTISSKVDVIESNLKKNNDNSQIFPLINDTNKRVSGVEKKIQKLEEESEIFSTYINKKISQETAQTKQELAKLKHEILNQSSNDEIKHLKQFTFEIQKDVTILTADFYDYKDKINEINFQLIETKESISILSDRIQELNSYQNLEYYKFVDYANGNVKLNSGETHLINNLRMGNSKYERSGKIVNYKRIEVSIDVDAQSIEGPLVVGIIYDKEPYDNDKFKNQKLNFESGVNFRNSSLYRPAFSNNNNSLIILGQKRKYIKSSQVQTFNFEIDLFNNDIKTSFDGISPSEFGAIYISVLGGGFQNINLKNIYVRMYFIDN